jgi:methylase of polypeptide subunit release factors
VSPPTPYPAFPDVETARAVRAGFASAGYEEGALCAALGCSSWTDLSSLSPAAVEHRAARGRSPALHVLVRLFPLASSVPAETAAAALGQSFLAALERSGIVERDGAEMRAAVALTPMEGLLFASDRRDRHAQRAADFVLGPGGVTRYLADLALPSAVGSVLDLGCGAGILGALRAARAERVVATDVNARAVAFTRFNAELNSLDNMSSREGSLFDPVRGERFDLILCNPPYVISPDSTYTYRDGGTELCRSIVRDAEAHLTERGTLQMLAEWPQRDGVDWRDEVGAWLEGSGCDAWVLRIRTLSASAYASLWLAQEYGKEAVPTEAFASWVGYLEGLGIAAVGGGLIVLRTSRSARAVRVLRDAPRIVPPAGASLERWLEGQELLASGDERALLDVPLAPAEGLERREVRAPSGAGWTDAEAQLRVTRGLAFGAGVDPIAAEVVGWLDGQRTPREALDLVARRFGVDSEPFLGGLPGALARLVQLGILHPPSGGA